jgi:hypothetical protein
MAVFGPQIALLRRWVLLVGTPPSPSQSGVSTGWSSECRPVVIVSSVLSELTQQIWAETAIFPGPR